MDVTQSRRQPTVFMANFDGHRGIWTEMGTDNLVQNFKVLCRCGRRGMRSEPAQNWFRNSKVLCGCSRRGMRVQARYGDGAEGRHHRAGLPRGRQQGTRKP